jgi:hypothetical protein
MYLIDVRRRNKEILDLAREARDKYKISISEFYRLAVINAFAIEVAPATRKTKQYSTDMSKLIYINDAIMDVFDDDFDQRDFRNLCALVGVAGSAIRKNMPSFGTEEVDIRRLRVAPDLIRGLIYARER